MTAPRPTADAIAFWVFGYGSLMWNPEFSYVRRDLAVLQGYRRSFCMRSIHHRGTDEAPGLVLALDHAAAASCAGVAFAVGRECADATLAALRARELVSSAYLERRLQVRLQGGESVEAVTYVVDPDHVQYCGDLPLEEQAQIIARAVGGRGRNRDYLDSTEQHLRDLGLADPDLAWLARRVAALPRG